MFTQSNYTSTFEESIFCNGFTPVISTATHKKPNCRFTCIDNIFVNNHERVINSCTLESHISHHRSLILAYSLKADPCTSGKPIKPKSKISYDYKPQNLDHLNEILAHNLFKTPMWQHETDFEEFLSLFRRCIDASCKLKNPKISKRNKQDNPWITTGLINSISKRDRLYKLWKRTQTKRCTTGNPRLQEQYRKYRNMLSNLIKQSKQKCYIEQFERASGNMKKTWSIINNLRGKNQTSSSFCIKEGNSVITDEKVIANKFNKHFCSLADNLNKDIRKPQACNFRDYLPPSQASSIFLEKTTTAEIISIIEEFENDKSSDIPIIVIKHCAMTIAPTLSSLFNKYIESGEFPNVLKIGRISPIYKKDAKDNIKNYRPISTLPIFRKIFEKVLYSRIYDYVTSKNILSKTQFGFRKLHATSHAIHQSVNFIKKSHSASKHVIGTFIDLSKAFDTIDHNTLLTKLYNYSIRGTPHNLIKSYLSNRKQYVKIGDEKSEKLVVKYGVPQGSVLGPLLFLLYINDLKHAIKSKASFEIILYADDTNIFVACESLESAKIATNAILSEINTYMVCNLLHINIDKSCFMYFPPNRKFLHTSKVRRKSNKKDSKIHMQTEVQKTGLSISIASAPIKEVTEAKFLGVWFDPTLIWNFHIRNTRNKLATSIAIIKRILPFIPKTNH